MMRVQAVLNDLGCPRQRNGWEGSWAWSWLGSDKKWLCATVACDGGWIKALAYEGSAGEGGAKEIFRLVWRLEADEARAAAMMGPEGDIEESRGLADFAALVGGCPFDAEVRPYRAGLPDAELPPEPAPWEAIR